MYEFDGIKISEEEIRRYYNAYMRNYAERNRKERNAYKREWNKRNPDKVRAINQRYWAKKAAEAKRLQQEESGKDIEGNKDTQDSIELRGKHEERVLNADEREGTKTTKGSLCREGTERNEQPGSNFSIDAEETIDNIIRNVKGENV